MNYREFKFNKEVGKLVQFAYDLHKRNFNDNIPGVGFCNTGKKYKDGGIWGKIWFSAHETVNASIILYVTKKIDKQNKITGKIHAFQTTTGNVNVTTTAYDITLSRYILLEEGRTDLKYDCTFSKLTDDEEIDEFIDYMEYLGFIREDIIDVINHKLTAREAYQHVAPQKYKDRQWICDNGKFYEFDKTTAISGDYGGKYIDKFPFPFDEQPILDCARVSTSSIVFGDNKRRIKLINVNSNPNSIRGADLREAIIDEVIDASKVDIRGTKFGEHKIINLDKSLSSYNKKDVALADTGVDYGKPKTRIKLLSDASTLETLIEGLSEGSEGIGLFRNEFIVGNDQEISLNVLKIIDSINPDKNDSTHLKIFEKIYNNCCRMYSLVGDKNIVFRLTDYHIEDLARKYGYRLKNSYRSSDRGADLLSESNLKEILHSEVKAIIHAAKCHKKIAKILVPYVCYYISFSILKEEILCVAKEEDYFDIEIGAMIEAKEAVPKIDKIIDEEPDFISIGTNDLTESVLGKKRDFNDPDFSILNQKVKKAMKEIVNVVKAMKDIPIYICGEHANYVDNLEYLLSLNINGITVHPNMIRGYNVILNNYYENLEKKVLMKED
ncbi:putative PEP-binding protein [Methanosphaera sp.]|uniref:putative PEP-binding protein n=1 Tax=Methanosphaera sp. TaxID=2666342 RepID=UPI0025E8710E|nr:putative PEP-binding protein [Methanosphaera sp.]